MRSLKELKPNKNMILYYQVGKTDGSSYPKKFNKAEEAKAWAEENKKPFMDIEQVTGKSLKGEKTWTSIPANADMSKFPAGVIA